MVVDEANLETTIRTLRALNRTYENKIDHMLNLIKSFTKIQLIDGQLPPDPDTGQPMTQTRRDEIYDNCITEANRLLGIE